MTSIILEALAKSRTTGESLTTTLRSTIKSKIEAVKPTAQPVAEPTPTKPMSSPTVSTSTIIPVPYTGATTLTKKEITAAGSAESVGQALEETPPTPVYIPPSAPLTEISKTGISITPEEFRAQEELGVKLIAESTAPIYAAGAAAIGGAAAVYGAAPLLSSVATKIGASEIAKDVTAAATTKIVHKTIQKGGLKLIGGAIAGLGLGALLFGGNKQEVTPTQITAAEPEQTTSVDQTQDLVQRLRDLFAAFRAGQQAQTTVTPTTTPTTTTTYDVTGGAGAIEIGGTTTYNVQETFTPTYQGLTQEQIGTLSQMLQGAAQSPAQITIQTPAQTTTATQMDLGWIAVIAAVGIGALILMREK